ncbi:MAG: hypothetical protein AAGH41_09110 [Pseudomonadota bacterium]
MKLKTLCAVSALGLTACGGGNDDPALSLMPPGGVLLAFSAATDENGACRPERRDVVDVGTTSLYAIRGETRFVQIGGITRIPFQSVHKFPDEKGFSEDTSVSALNQQEPCENLRITITIESCEYSTDKGLEKRACPAIGTSGSSAFADVELVREDK